MEFRISGGRRAPLRSVPGILALVLLLLLRPVLSAPAHAAAVADPNRDSGSVPHITHLTGGDAAFVAAAPGGPRTSQDDVPPAEPAEIFTYVPVPRTTFAGATGDPAHPRTAAPYSPAAPRGPPLPAGL